MLDHITQEMFLGGLAALISATSMMIYIRTLRQNKTKPHIFTWVIWCLLCTIAAAIQIAEGAGPGAWVTVISAILSGVIMILAFKVGDRDITRSDWVLFIGALTAIPIWLMMDNPALAAIILTVIDSSAFLPTMRKVYHRPDTEPVVPFVISSFSFFCAFAALEHVSIETGLYVFGIGVMNLLLVLLLLWRRKALSDAN